MTTHWMMYMTKISFLTALEAGVWDQSVGRVGFSWDPSPLLVGGLLLKSSHVFLPLGVCALIASYKDASCIGLVPTLMTSFNLRNLFKDYQKTFKNKDHGIWSHHFMANRWETIETVRDFIFLGIKITADGDCSHEIQRRLFLWRKAMINLDSILKSRDITLSTNVRLVKAMVFPVVMCGCESLTIKKAEHQRIDAFELWCWRRLLRVPWTARRSNQSILKETNPEYLLKGLMLKLKLQSFGHLMWRTDSLEKTLMLGKIEGRRRRGRQRMRWLDGITDSIDMS